VAVEAKVCGLTRPEDAVLAVAHGAARLGVVFAWGPRVVTVAQASAIVAASRGVPVLAVVAGGSAADCRDLAARTGVRGFQLHGDVDPLMAAELQAAGFEVWRVATLESVETVSRAVATARLGADAVLVEPHVAGGSGGRGVVLDRRLACQARAALDNLPMVLAGGLRPESVGEAIRLVSPDFVDVSSGVESAPGCKDAGRLVQFLEAVRDAGSADRHRA
jgi:phosphoribosylanthranilate isomerase